MKETSLISEHLKLGAKMVPFAGYNMPVEYSGVIKEHMAVRNAVGVFDVSHMGEFWVKGEGALALLQKVTTNDVSNLSIGQAQYTCMPNGEGGIVDDLIIYYYDDLKYLAVVNASNIQKDWDWMNKHNIFGAELENASESMSLIAVQGPKAQEVLQTLTDYKLDSINPFNFVTTNIAGASEVIVSATGYTGAGGFELYCYNDNAVKIWQSVMDAGKTFGIEPAGLAARDTLRLEMGYCLYGNDIDDRTSPIEAGLGWIVKFKDNKNFIDKELLFEQKRVGIDKKLVGLELISRGIPRHGYEVVNEQEEVVGEVTSGTMSPILKKGIGMAYVKKELAKPNAKLFIKIRNKLIEAKVVKFPFI